MPDAVWYDYETVSSFDFSPLFKLHRQDASRQRETSICVLRNVSAVLPVVISQLSQ